MNRIESLFNQMLKIRDTLNLVDPFRLASDEARTRLETDKSILYSNIEIAERIIKSNGSLLEGGGNVDEWSTKKYMEMLEEYISYFDGLLINEKNKTTMAD